VIKLARGEYFKLAAADDLCDENLVSRCVEVLDADPTVVLAYAMTTFIDQDGSPLSITDPGWHLPMESPQERLVYVISCGHWVNVFFGLARSRQLAATRLFPTYAGGDCRLLGELCLQGRFVEIPERLFIRRLHPEASSQNPDVGWQSRFFKGRSGCLELPFWHICLDHCRTILESNLSAAAKGACLRVVLDRMFSGKRELFLELCRSGRYVWRDKAHSLKQRLS